MIENSPKFGEQGRSLINSLKRSYCIVLRAKVSKNQNPRITRRKV